LIIAADDVHTLQCFQLMASSPIVRSADELDAALESCDGPSSSSFDVDWDSQLVYLAIVPERPNAGLGSLTLTDEGVVVVGIEAPAYCGGAAPATGIVAVELPATYDDVTQQTCYTGSCGDGPLPPSTPPDQG
jgi:hypothetical protein